MFGEIPPGVEQLRALARGDSLPPDRPTFRTLPSFSETVGGVRTDGVQLNLWVGSLSQATRRANAIAVAAYAQAASESVRNRVILRKLGRTARAFFADKQHLDSTQATVVWIKNTSATPLSHANDDLALVPEWTTVAERESCDVESFAAFPKSLLKCGKTEVFTHRKDSQKLWIYAIRECWRVKLLPDTHIAVERVVASKISPGVIRRMSAASGRERLLERTALHTGTEKGSMITLGIVGPITYHGASITVDKESGLLTGLSSYRMPVSLAWKKGQPMGVADAVRHWHSQNAGEKA